MEKTPTTQRIVIFNYGSQYTQLIARRVREQHVYSEILPFTTTAAQLRGNLPAGIILSGGPDSVFDDGAPGVDPAIFELGVPVLGICYGMQLICHKLGGTVKHSAKREYGKTDVSVSKGGALFSGLPEKFTVWMSHGDSVAAIPQGFAPAAASANCPYAAIADEARRFYALQFHPEVVHTEYGGKIISNFLFGVCSCRPDWNMDTWIADTVRALKEQIGDDEVVLGLSGGVDSSVVAVLLNQAIGPRLHCIFVDNGLLRHNEAEAVEQMFRAKLGLDLHVARAAQRFYAALKGLENPEDKRKAIGREFVNVFAEEARKFKNCKFLAQGTIYPDVIESSSSKDGPSQTIKSHHNVGGLPPDLKFALVEPLRDLFKDEVRAVGRLLGLDAEFLDRQPFPGPPRPRRAHPRRGDGGKGEAAPAGGRPRAGGNAQAAELQVDLAVLRRPASLPLRWRNGRPAHLRIHLRHPVGRLDRRDDGGLVAHPLRHAGDDLQPDHQRGARHQPRRLRHLVQAAGDDRMGIGG